MGKIRDLLIDLSNGEVAEATIGVRHFVPIRERLASVTWKSVTLPEKEQYAAVAMDAKALSRIAQERGEYWENLGFKGNEAPVKATPPESRREGDLWDNDYNSFQE